MNKYPSINEIAHIIDIPDDIYLAINHKVYYGLSEEELYVQIPAIEERTEGLSYTTDFCRHCIMLLLGWSRSDYMKAYNYRLDIKNAKEDADKLAAKLAKSELANKEEHND